MIRKHLQMNGMTLSHRDVYISGIPIELDLLVLRPGSESICGVVYSPSDVIAALEIKYGGAYGGNAVPAIKKSFDRITTAHPHITCAYVTIKERKGYRYAATDTALGYPTYTLHWYSNTKPEPEATDDWSRLLEKLKA